MPFHETADYGDGQAGVIGLTGGAMPGSGRRAARRKQRGPAFFRPGAASKRFWPAALALAGVGAEFSPVPTGPTPLLLTMGAVFLSGFLVGRRTPFLVAAFTAVALSSHLLLALHASAMTPDGGPPLAWRPFIAFGALTVVALVSSLAAGSLEDARTHARELAEINVALEDANTRLQALTTTDPLTGLLNHRGLVAALDTELGRARRAERPCALLFLDIDHFKALNDGYGHGAGDAVLQEFARLMRGSLRPADLLGRLGGEEFVVLLPEMEAGGAAALAERVRAGIAEHLFPVAGGLRLTCSIGTASYPADGTERGRLLDAADHAMYVAKRLGRNQVRAADDPTAAALLMN